MAWYKSGTVAVTNGSTTVTGTSTAWVDNTRVGDAFIGPDGLMYEITARSSDTSLTIYPAYRSATASGAAYMVGPLQGYIKDSADKLSALAGSYVEAQANITDHLAGGSTANGDGNKHPPATGTSSSGKFLKAGASAGAMSWSTLTPDDISGLLAWLQNFGNAATATKLQTARWLNIGNTGKSFDGSADVWWSLDEIGAARIGVLADGTNLNTVVASGFYRLSDSPANAPEGVNYGQIIVARGGEGSVLQIVTGWGNGEIYWRQGNPPEAGNSGGWWRQWNKFYHSGNISSANAGTATKLQTARWLNIGNTGKSFDGSTDVSWSLDEIGAAKFAGLADGTDLNKVVNAGFYRISNSPVNAPDGVAYGQLIVSRGFGDSVLQIVTGVGNGEIYWRQGNPPDTGGPGSWGPWHRFYHSGNLTGSLSGYGYQKLPGGLIMQWGTTLPAPTDGSIYVTFPIAFPSSCASVVAQQTIGTSGGGVNVPGWAIPSKSTTGFTLQNDSVDQVFYWIALGY